ncbi:MAG: DNA polymerase IV [Acidimicrobiia bacterium]|nr:DNA polymerase IV [Acidimicrobiia bacterium]
MEISRFAECILHVDMDAFFVEVERRDRPDLRGRPVVVGGTGNRGVVAAASYEARTFGVNSAMPMVHARRLCPKAVVLPPDHRKYRVASEEVFAIFRSFTPLVEGLSLDEAFLDVSGLRHHYPDAVAVGSEIRARLRTELNLPASVGIATNKFLAKLASEAAKPDGLRHVPADQTLMFLHSLPVRSLWGVGEATHAALERLGVATVGDLADVPAATLIKHLGQAAGNHLHELAWGRDPRPVEPESVARSISVEETYERDLEGKEAVEGELLRHADRLAARLRAAGVAGRTVTIKIRFADFTTITRSEKLESSTDVARDVYRSARDSLGNIALAGRPIRLVGVGMTSLTPASAPRQLAVDRPAKWDDLAEAVDQVRSRYGTGSIRPARLVESVDRED